MGALRKGTAGTGLGFGPIPAGTDQQHLDFPSWKREAGAGKDPLPASLNSSAIRSISSSPGEAQNPRLNSSWPTECRKPLLLRDPARLRQILSNSDLAVLKSTSPRDGSASRSRPAGAGAVLTFTVRRYRASASLAAMTRLAVFDSFNLRPTPRRPEALSAAAAWEPPSASSSWGAGPWRDRVRQPGQGQPLPLHPVCPALAGCRSWRCPRHRLNPRQTSSAPLCFWSSKTTAPTKSAAEGMLQIGRLPLPDGGNGRRP